MKARMVPLSEGEVHLHDYVNSMPDVIRPLHAKYRYCSIIIMY